MKKTYQTPDFSLIVFTADELRTDVLSASQPQNIDSMKWSNFVE